MNRSEEENIIISDLSPATWYSVQLTAHNGAGSRVVTSQVMIMILMIVIMIMIIITRRWPH